jgi:DNA-directed RNA polymerase specialized sigma24 family protein
VDSSEKIQAASATTMASVFLDGVSHGLCAESSNRPLESFREYLRLLARMNMDPRLQARIDPSDLAQQTLLKAHERQDQFRGKTDAERAAWLRTILANQVATPCARKHNLRRTGLSSRSSFLLIERWGETCVMITGSQKLHGRPTR